MTVEERRTLELERYSLAQQYRLTDSSGENIARKARIKEIDLLIGRKPAERKKTWLDSSCKKYAKYL